MEGGREDRDVQRRARPPLVALLPPVLGRRRRVVTVIVFVPPEGQVTRGPGSVGPPPRRTLQLRPGAVGGARDAVETPTTVPYQGGLGLLGEEVQSPAPEVSPHVYPSRYTPTLLTPRTHTRRQ